MNIVTHSKASLATLSLAVSAALATGCADMSERERGTAQGAGIGAVAGAVIGASTGGKAGSGALIGGALGAVAAQKTGTEVQIAAGSELTIALASSFQVKGL